MQPIDSQTCLGEPGGDDRIRLAIFGSFYRGYHLLKEALHGPLAGQVRVVGVATDDPSHTFVSPHKRVWQYPHEKQEETMVREYAEAAGIEVWNGKVKAPEFYEIYEQRWRPELCIMGTFGQLIDQRLFDYPRLGFYNLHPCFDDAWPSHYVGGNPFDALMRDGKPYTVIAMHRVDATFDTGELIAYSEHINFPPNASVVEMHKLTAPFAAKLAAHELARIIAGAPAAEKDNIHPLHRAETAPTANAPFQPDASA